MDDLLSDSGVQDIKLASKKLTGFKRRQFQAEMAEKYCSGSPRLAETRFGWDRNTVTKALSEKRTGICCLDNFSQRGRKRTEELKPEIQHAIVELVEPQVQADPKFHTTFAYTRVTAQAVRTELLKDPELAPHVPSRETVGAILNRLNYRLRPVKKTAPEKKFPETDAIFANVKERREAAVLDDECLRISIDSKAKVKIGPFSRGGLGRGQSLLNAVANDMGYEALLVPFGILEIGRGTSQSINFGLDLASLARHRTSLRTH